MWHQRSWVRIPSSTQKPMQTHRLFCCSKAASPSLSNVVMWTLRAQSQYLSLPCNSCNSSLRHQDLFFAASATLPCNSRNSQWAASCRRGISVQSYCPLCNKIVLWWALPLFRRQSPRVYCPLRNAGRYHIPIRSTATTNAGRYSLGQKQAPQPSLKAAGPARLNLT